MWPKGCCRRDKEQDDLDIFIVTRVVSLCFRNFLQLQITLESLNNQLLPENVTFDVIVVDERSSFHSRGEGI